MDADGDALSSVEVTSLPAKGEIKLDGTALASGDLPQTVTATRAWRGQAQVLPAHGRDR